MIFLKEINTDQKDSERAERDCRDMFEYVCLEIVKFLKITSPDT